MNEINPTPSNPRTVGAVSLPPDPRPPFALVVDLAGEVLDHVDAAAERDVSVLRRPTPCSTYDLGVLAAHQISVLRRVAAVGRGEDPWSVPQETPGLEPTGFGAAWNEAKVEQRRVWSDDRVLGTMLDLPFGTLPGAAALGVYVGEVLVHTWDLAQAAGIVVDQWPEEIVDRALEGAMAGLPADGRGDAVPFDPVVPVPADAPAIDRLVAWMGRQP